MLPGYKDPYSDRVLTKGEIGCFLSHYNIWKKVHSKMCSTISCYINKLLMVLNANFVKKKKEKKVLYGAMKNLTIHGKFPLHKMFFGLLKCPSH